MSIAGIGASVVSDLSEFESSGLGVGVGFGVGVGAVPGSSFFREPVNHLIRLHFAKKDETLNDALNRLEFLREKIPANG